MGRVHKELAVSYVETQRLDDTIARMNTTISTNGVSISQSRGLSVDGRRIGDEGFITSRRELEFELDGYLGAGACSIVRKAYKVRDPNMKYAVKIFKILDEGRRHQLMKEIRVLAQLECDALVQFHGAYFDEARVGVVLEFMDMGSLESVLEKEKKLLPEKVLGAIFFQIMWGLAYLHFDKRLHRDIKPGNILLNSKGQVKVSDFGIAREMGDEAADIATSTVVGTFRYMSPERLHGSRYSYASDVWSAGIVLVDAACGKPLFSTGASPVEIVQRLKDEGDQLAANALHPNASNDLLQLATDCLRIDPLYRPSCADLLGNQWLAASARFPHQDASFTDDSDEACIEGAAFRLQSWFSSNENKKSQQTNRIPQRQKVYPPPAANTDTLLETMRSSIGDDDDDECNLTRQDSLSDDFFNKNSAHHTYHDLTKSIEEEEASTTPIAASRGASDHRRQRAGGDYFR